MTGGQTRRQMPRNYVPVTYDENDEAIGEDYEAQWRRAVEEVMGPPIVDPETTTEEEAERWFSKGTFGPCP